MIPDWLYNWWQEWSWVFVVPLVTLTILAVVVGGVIGLTTWLGGISCQATAAIMQVPYYYSYQTGCMIQVYDQWLPLSNYIVVETETQ
jgi:hypothetical protein